MTDVGDIIALTTSIDKVSEMAQTERMKNFSARDAKNQFGLLIDTARLEPVVIEKHGRPVAVVCSIEEFERLTRSVCLETAPEDEQTK